MERGSNGFNELIRIFFDNIS